jgi:hypothetical protein
MQFQIRFLEPINLPAKNGARKPFASTWKKEEHAQDDLEWGWGRPSWKQAGIRDPGLLPLIPS